MVRPAQTNTRSATRTPNPRAGSNPTIPRKHVAPPYLDDHQPVRVIRDMPTPARTAREPEMPATPPHTPPLGGESPPSASFERVVQSQAARSSTPRPKAVTATPSSRSMPGAFNTGPVHTQPEEDDDEDDEDENLFVNFENRALVLRTYILTLIAPPSTDEKKSANPR